MANFKIKNNPLLGNTLKLTGGSVINYVIPIVSTPILARLFTPADYWDWGIFSSIVTIFTVFICGGYEFAIVESQDNKEKSHISQLCLLICLVVNFLLLSIILISDSVGVNVFGFDSSWLIPLYLLFAGFNNVLYNISNSRKLYKKLAMAQVISGLAMAVTRIIMGLVHTPHGLIYGAIFSLVLVCVWMFISTEFYKEIYRRAHFSDFKKIAKKYKNYPLFDAPSTLLVYLSNNLPILILGYFFGKNYVGCYTMVLHLLLLPMAFIGSNMSKVFIQQISEPSCNIIKSSKNVFNISFLLGFAIIFFFVAGGDYILYKFLGGNWEIAGVYALYLSLWSFFTIMFAPLKPIYRIKKKQNIQMIIVTVSFIVQCGILLLSSLSIKDVGLIVCLYSICCSFFKIIEGLYLMKLCGSIKAFRSLLFTALCSIAVLAWGARAIYSI